MNKRVKRPMPTPEHPGLLRVDEVAELLGVSHDRAYSLIRAGQIPGVVRLGRAIYIRSTEFYAWLLGGVG